MPRKIRINLENKTNIPVLFKVNDHEEKASPGLGISVEVETVDSVEVRPVNRDEAEADFWHSVVTEDTNFKCDKYGSELKLHF